MLMVSREMVSRPLGVILTARRAVFICGETEAMVPLTIVPVNLFRVMLAEKEREKKREKGRGGWSE